VPRGRLSDIDLQLGAEGEALVNPTVLAEERHAQRSGLKQRFCGHFDAVLNAPVVGERHEAGPQWHARKA
jgi:hypothetical protein